MDNHRHKAFLPVSLEAKKQRLREAEAQGDLSTVALINKTWIDLRAAYACTINKSQGSTYDKVFIDLDDLKRCNQPNTLARLLYVAVSRARYQVIFTGDLV
jgi:ATP-dependent exoDNAse (exonuclease V) alpha subunit